MAKTGYTTIDRDCSLDLHEALQLLALLFNTFETANHPDDWYQMKAPIGSGILAVENYVRVALNKVSPDPWRPANNPTRPAGSAH